MFSLILFITAKTSVILEKKLLNDPVNEASSSTNCDSEEGNIFLFNIYSVFFF